MLCFDVLKRLDRNVFSLQSNAFVEMLHLRFVMFNLMQQDFLT